jgi:hypothetical protein
MREMRNETRNRVRRNALRLLRPMPAVGSSISDPTALFSKKAIKVVP